MKKWEALLNILVSKEFHTILVREQTNVFLICSDIIRVKVHARPVKSIVMPLKLFQTEIWNMNFCRSDTLVDHTETIKSLIESVEKTMDSGIQLNSPLSGLALPVSNFCLILLWDELLVNFLSLVLVNLFSYPIRFSESFESVFW